MKFNDLLEDILNEGKNFTDDKFDRYANNAGMWLFEVFIDNISKVTTMPGYLEYRDYVTKNSKYSAKELGNLDNLVMTLPDYYKYFINEIDYKLSNRIMGRTISMFNLADKMSGRDNSVPMKKGRKPKMQDAQPEMEPRADDAMAHFDQAVDEPTSYEDIAKTFKPRGGARPGAGRPSMSKFEPQMADTRIKTLEDKIASLEALLKEKGILQEERARLKSRLQMMIDYEKFL